MDYPLENLDPERFQYLCQALIAKEVPGTQCYPVGQPDGGRDAVGLYYLEEGSSQQFTVFQVKFVRNPFKEADPHKWLVGILEDEAPKLAKLIPKGAARFVLITNVPGTSHLETGSIDVVASILSENVGVSSQCWWRNDINRRLDSAWDVKWTYPEVMAGADFLRTIIESGLSEHRERRSASVRAFLRHQYDLDEQVRFKQVDLQNRLVDLFVDVPISIRSELPGRKQVSSFFRAVVAASSGAELEEIPSDIDWDLYTRQRYSHPHVGGARLLLSPHTATYLPHVVIEGAPGQGKSTITQYVCQLYRMRLLNESADFGSIPEKHRELSHRLPIRVDLRDFATWIGRGNPFTAEDNVPVGWNKSLESFLAALVSSQSGGTAFSNDDLYAVARISALILVFDGLDEVADISTRKEVVDELAKGIRRLDENCASLQTIVTSRPAAFANSPGMPERRFVYLELHSLSSELIMEYSERWFRARRLDSRLAAESRRLLKTRLDQPHLRDLARNPMQLTILLSLVHTRGPSLPDKRTALYDFYIDLFFNREAEKSLIVRDNRDLLIDLHGYLGWELHSEAEKGDARASISADRLEKLVANYLKNEGRDPGLASKLFAGVVERVVALVSRIEGTFEFEVQPLREYFAARFLFDTAPASSPGKEKPGARPDRFDALARNFYWLNVTRFFAGCYSKGELSSLVERLQDLCREDGYHRISGPRILAATLLSDWVFAQNPKSVQQAVDLVVDDVGLRRILAESSRYKPTRGLPTLTLPNGSGRDQLVARALRLLEGKMPADVEQDVIELLKQNCTQSEMNSAWTATLEQLQAGWSSESRNRWMRIGLHSGVLAQYPLDQLKRVLETGSSDDRTLTLLLRAGRWDYMEEAEGVFNSCIQQILNGANPLHEERRARSVLEVFAQAINPVRYSIVFSSRQPVPLRTVLSRRGRYTSLVAPEQVLERVQAYENYRRAVEFIGRAGQLHELHASQWATDIGPWSEIVEALRVGWGESRAVLQLAALGSGIRTTSEKCSDASDLFDEKIPLARRARFARLRAGSTPFWSEQLKRAVGTDSALRVAFFAIAWAGTSALVGSLPELSACLNSLTSSDWNWLLIAGRQVRTFTMNQRSGQSGARADLTKLSVSTSVRAACVIADRLPPHLSDEFYLRTLRGRWHEDSRVLDFAQASALDLGNFGTELWRPDLQLIQRCYENGAAFEPIRFRRALSQIDRNSIPLGIAQAIANRPLQFPGFLVKLSDERCRQDVASRITPMRDIAARDQWFVD